MGEKLIVCDLRGGVTGLVRFRIASMAQCEKASTNCRQCSSGTWTGAVLIRLHSGNEKLHIDGIPAMALFCRSEIVRTSGTIPVGQIVQWGRDHQPMATA